jgi:hypothetical protein
MSLPWEALVPPSGNNHSDGRGPYPGSVHFPQALDRPGSWDYQHAAVEQDPFQGVWVDSKLNTLGSISDQANTRVVDCTQQAVSSYKTVTDAIAQCRCVSAGGVACSQPRLSTPSLLPAPLAHLLSNGLLLLSLGTATAS